MEARAVVNIGPRNSNRVFPPAGGGDVSISDWRRFEGVPNLSETVCRPFVPMNEPILPEAGAFEVSHLKLSKPPTIINVTPRKSRHPSIKVYESPHATMWLTPEPFNTSANVNLPDSSPIRHRSISCLAPRFPVTPSSESKKKNTKSNRKKSGATSVSENLTLPSHPRDPLIPSGLPALRDGPNVNYRQSSDPGNFPCFALRPVTPTSSPQWGRMVENSEDRSRRELESPRVTGPQVRAVPSPHPRQGFRPPSLSEMDNMVHGITSQWDTSIPTPKTPTMQIPNGLDFHNSVGFGGTPHGGWPIAGSPMTLTRTGTASPPPMTLGTPGPSILGIGLEGSEPVVPVTPGVRVDEDLELTTLPELGEIEPTESPPDRVVAKYSEDLNIIKIHEAIMTRFAYEEAEIPGLRAQVQTSHQGLHPGMTINERRQYLQQVDSMQSRLGDLQNRTALTNYLGKSLSILKAYKLVSSDASKGIVSIRRLGQKQEANPEKITNRLNIIQQYLEIARDYIILDVVQINQIKARCPGCGIDFSQVMIDEESGLCICDCGVERENLSQHSLYKDSTRVNIGNRNNYEDWENFEKALTRYQGRQQNKPPQKLYDQLDAYYRKIQKSLGVEIRARPSLSDGKKEGTSRQMMLDALCETNNSAYYDDVNLVMNVYWSWKLPDVAHLEAQIMQDYYLTQQVYNSEPHHGRDASLNTQFRLYVHLLAVGHRCCRDDFKIQTSRDSLEFHQEMWKKMCDKTGVKFHPVI